MAGEYNRVPECSEGKPSRPAVRIERDSIEELSPKEWVGFLYMKTINWTIGNIVLASY